MLRIDDGEAPPAAKGEVYPAAAAEEEEAFGAVKTEPLTTEQRPLTKSVRYASLQAREGARIVWTAETVRGVRCCGGPFDLFFLLASVAFPSSVSISSLPLPKKSSSSSSSSSPSSSSSEE